MAILFFGYDLLPKTGKNINNTNTSLYFCVCVCEKSNI